MVKKELLYLQIGGKVNIWQELQNCLATILDFTTAKAN